MNQPQQQKPPETQKSLPTNKPPATGQGTGAAQPVVDTESLRDYLFKNRERIEAEASVYLRGHNLIERLMSVAALIVHRDPKGKLQACTKISILNSIRESARLGLWIGGHKPQGYLIPYATECTFQISYFGIMAMLRRTGEVTDIRAHVVHKGDAFDYELGLTPWLKHKPHLHEHAKGDWTHVYAIIKLANAVDPLIEVMTKSEVLAIKGRSRASGEGPWVTDEERMALKTVLRRGSKMAPTPEDLEEQFAKEDSIDAVVIDRKETPRGNAGLEAALPQLTEGAPKVTLETPREADVVPAQREDVAQAVTH